MAMNEKKMNAKQAVSGGFDLNSFVGGADSPAPSTKQRLKSDSKPSETPKRTKPLVEAEKTLKVAKLASERLKENLTERVQIRLTSSEMAKLEKQCGLVPASTFLRNFMKENGLI
jgi:hypothetical protein